MLDLRRILCKHFGHESFTKEQECAILSAVEGKSVSLLYPTNFGKSICFQVPALYQDGARKGVTIVIEPTRVLIEYAFIKLSYTFSISTFIE
jgi:ATP-dependent DNA helicase RecQ